MTMLPIADARAQLSKLVDEASTTHERIEITKNGRRAAVLMGADDYDAMSHGIPALGKFQLSALARRLRHPGHRRSESIECGLNGQSKEFENS